jgi:two-component system response regulator HydG
LELGQLSQKWDSLLDNDQPTILCVDDEAYMLASIQRVFFDLEPPCTVITAGSGEQAVEILGERVCDLLIVDLHMPGMGGMALLSQLPQLAPNADAVVLTAIEDPQVVVQAMKYGAVDYLTKPFDNQRLLTTVGNLLQKRRLMQQNRLLRHALRERRVRPFVGRSAATRKVLELVKQAGRVRSNVLILGESGTGKEVVARSIHYYGESAEEPFVAVDCTAISPNLFESELFGHVSGAFTGATESREGMLRSAGEGTVFFDEVTEMPVTLQAKLLRAIQEREVKPVGSSTVHSFSARVVAATNRDPQAMITAGQFREDLYYRLSVIPILIPPLRQRREDIPLLVQHFMTTFHVEGTPTRSISDEALSRLGRYTWPGNVRELENCIERACALGVDTVIGVDDLPDHVVGVDGGPPPAPELDLAGRRGDAERDTIVEALAQSGGNRSKAAKLLGMGRSTLYRKLAQLGID